MRSVGNTSPGPVERLNVTDASNTMLRLFVTSRDKPICKGENSMNPLDSLGGTVAAGVVLSIILAYVAKALAGV